ncbi:MAG: CBS domain-containing protein [Haloarculaceae archaeon]
MTTGTQTQVEAVMSQPIETISQRATVREAATRMREHDFSALLAPGGETGIVTSTDVLGVVADGRDPESVTVADVMTAPVESVTAEMRLGEAAAMMTNYGIKHMPVRDSDGDYVGMISSTDVQEVLGE